MKDLVACTPGRLQQMEFITMMRETVDHIETKAATLLEKDAPLKRYTLALKAGTDALEEVTRNPQQRPETAVARSKNHERKLAISRFGLRFKVYRLSADESERGAYETLRIVWKKHRLLYLFNVAQLTGTTDNFLNDLTKEPFKAAVEKLNLQADVEAIRTANEAYRTRAALLRARQAERIPSDVGAMRRAQTADYTTLCLYVAVMADAYPEVEVWSAILSGLNVIRKHFAEILTRRAGARQAKKKEQEAEK